MGNSGPVLKAKAEELQGVFNHVKTERSSQMWNENWILDFVIKRLLEICEREVPL